MKNAHPGGKSGHGKAQRIIGELPPHRVYIAPFCGLDAVALLKRPADYNVFADADANTLARFEKLFREHWPHANAAFSVCDSTLHVDKLTRCFENGPTGRTTITGADVVVYCDPPYILETRRNAGRLYRHEMTEADHMTFLQNVCRVDAKIVISHYPHALYENTLCKWRKIEFETPTRFGTAIETLWFNFPPAKTLHDSRFVGTCRRSRQRVARRAKRWASELRRLIRSGRTREAQAMFDACAGVIANEMLAKPTEAR